MRISILHLTTYDTRGGAALCAYRLHEGLLKVSECRSRMLVREKLSEDPTVDVVCPRKDALGRALRLLEQRRVRRDYRANARRLSRVEKFSDDRGPWRDTILPHIRGFDVLHLHWIADFLNYRAFFATAPSSIPLVWTLHDKHPFTGGCHYNGGCQEFRDACANCPTLGGARQCALSRAIWRRKKAALARLHPSRLHIVANNHWMLRQVRASSLLGRFDSSVIPNGIDLNQFRPVSPEAAREVLGIPAGRKVITFVAEVISNYRKGFTLLMEALQALESQGDLFLLIVGDSRQIPDLGIPSLKVGTLQAVALLREAYSAAHVCVVPSLEDNQPGAVLEAMACGSPVVAFRAGGIPEMVEHGRTGLLVEPRNAQGLAESIRYLLDHEVERAAMGVQARTRVETEFSQERQVCSFLSLYGRMVNRATAWQDYSP